MTLRKLIWGTALAFVLAVPAASITRRRPQVVGRRAFAIGVKGRASVRIKLRKAALKRLRRKRILRLASRAVIKDSAGLRASTSGTIRLRVRRR